MVSFIIPCFNGDEILKRNLPILIDYLKKQKILHEVIIVDDGSKAPEKISAVASRYGCIFLKNETNLGKGAAVRRGMLQAKGDYCLYTDADIPFEVNAIEKFIYYLDFKEFDLVVGDRTLPEAEYFDNVSKLRKVGSRLFSFIVGRFVAGGFFDTQCGLKGFRANIAKDLFFKSRINGFAFDIELIYIALKRNYDIKRLPVKLRSNEGNSVKLFQHGAGMFLDIFRIKFHHLLGLYRK